MYADKSNPVSVPTELKEGKLIFLKNGYVYYATKSWWDSEKRRTIDNRISIGKMVPGESDKMFPGKNYFSFSVRAKLQILRQVISAVFINPRLGKRRGSLTLSCHTDLMLY